MLTKNAGVRLESLLDASLFMPWRTPPRSRRSKDADPKIADIGFTYRRRPSVFPGVSLAFSTSDFGTRVGARPASATARNSWENSWGNSLDAVSDDPVPRSKIEAGTQVSPVAATTSGGLGQLRELMNQAARRRQELRDRIDRAGLKLKSLELRLAIARFPILALFLSWMVDGLRQGIANIRAEIDACSKEQQLNIIDLDFDLGESAEAAYTQLKFSFDHLSGCHRIWDVASGSLVGQPAEGITARSRGLRAPVRVGRSTLAILNSPRDVLRFDKANGAPLLIYPGVVIMQEDDGNFALADIRDLDLKFTDIGYIEEAEVPGDTHVIDTTWKRVNRDGSRELGFQDNHQIPIVQYGSIEFTSQTGIGGAYHFSDADKAALFAADFEAFKRALSFGANSSISARFQGVEAPHTLEDPAIEPVATQVWPEVPKKPTGLRLLAEMSVVLACFALFIYLGTWSTPQLVAVGESNLSGSAGQIPAAPANNEPVGVGQSEATAGAPAADKASSKAPEKADANYTATVKLKRANVRAGPRKSATIVATLKKGRAVTLLEQKGDWYRVQWGHDTGWMHRSTMYLSNVPTLLSPQ